MMGESLMQELVRQYRDGALLLLQFLMVMTILVGYPAFWCWVGYSIGGDALGWILGVSCFPVTVLILAALSPLVNALHRRYWIGAR